MRYSLFVIGGLLLIAANTKLYLKNGEYQVVREYQVLADRVRYYSIERSDWEEIPLELVDLPKTKATVAALETEVKADEKAEAEEAAAERAIRKEIRSVPTDSGLYYVLDGQPMKPLKQAELTNVSDKKRTILKAITPIPILAGKSHVEIKGAQSEFVIDDDRPEFYFRLSKDERFGLVRCVAAPKTGNRIVEKWEIVPVVKEILVVHEDVEIFRKQVAEGLYKVWPLEPLPTGEYAWVEFTEGKGNTQAWDFSVRRKR